MSQPIKRTQRDYSLSFKLSVVDQVEKGEMSYREAQHRYGIQGRSTVLTWLRKHGRLDWSSGQINESFAMDKSTKPLAQTPEQRIKELEQALARANDKAEFFESVLQVLKKDYGVRIVKKPSTKPLKKE